MRLSAGPSRSAPADRRAETGRRRVRSTKNSTPRRTPRCCRHFVEHVWSNARFAALHREWKQPRGAPTGKTSPCRWYSRSAASPGRPTSSSAASTISAASRSAAIHRGSCRRCRKSLPGNRLGPGAMAVGQDHPLTCTGRVNRLWQGHVRTGLVKTAEDFGAQGERPSHPGLLDWLAVRFRRRAGTSRQMKRIVLSASYRQSSRGSSKDRPW